MNGAMDRREREMIERAKAQRLWMPGDDQFDTAMKTWYALPGFYMFWMVLVRMGQAIGRMLPARAKRRPQRPPLWTVGPKPAPEGTQTHREP